MAERVYIVDEDRGSAALIAQTLEAAGYLALTYPTPDAFAQLAADRPPGWLVMDVGGPGAERIGAIRALREHGYDWPVIAMCAVPDLPLAARSLHAGARDVIVKPFTPEELIEMLRAAAALLD